MQTLSIILRQHRTHDVTMHVGGFIQFGLRVFGTSLCNFCKQPHHSNRLIRRSAPHAAALKQIALSFSLMDAIAMGIASAKEAVPPKNKYIDPLIPGDPSGNFKRLLLGLKVARNPCCARLADCPLLPARNNILTISYHWRGPPKIRWELYYRVLTGDIL